MANSNYRLRSLIAIFLAVNSIANSQKPSDSFRESLTIRPLQDGKLHTLFKFELSTQLPTRPLESPTSSNIKLLQSDLLPLSILELTDRFGINQLSLSLSRGRWEFDRWSAPILEQWQGYPRGSELAVWLEPHANATELINTLAGMFCGSLNRLNLIKDAPLELFNPTFSDQHGHRSFYHGLLPIEQPCTENLSPLFKLLPCGPHAGLSSLIDGHQLFDGNWQSIRFKSFNYQSALELSPATRPSNSNSKLEIQIEIETVLDPVRKTTKRDWNLKSIFGKSVEKKCPLSSSSVIEIIEPTGPTETESLQRPTIHPRAHADGLPVEGRHKYDILGAVLPLDIEMKWPSEDKFEYPERFAPPPVTIKRLLLGHGQTRGLMGVEIEMSQSEVNKEQEIVYLEELPWWLTIYLHTLTVEVDDVPIDDQNEVITNKKIKPSLQRERPYSFALTLKFPKQKGGGLKKGSRKMKIWFEYEKDLLLYTEYASDANRGFDLNPAGLILTDSILQAADSVHRAGHRLGNASRTGSDGSRRYWTTCALIDLATPDFSMPYNVIIVTSTAMALFFGSVFNLLVRDFQLVKIKQ